MPKTILEHVIDGSIVIDSLEASKSILKDHPDCPELLKIHADLLAADRQQTAAADHYARAAVRFLSQGRPFQAWVAKTLQWTLQRPRPDQLLDFHLALGRAPQTEAPVDGFVRMLAPPERMAVFSRFQRLRSPGGRSLMKAGAPQSRLYLVVSGLLRESSYETVSQKPRPGREASRTLREADAFGEVYPFNGDSPGRSHVEAVGRSELLVLSKSHLIRVCRRFPNVESGLIRLCGVRAGTREAHLSNAVRRGERYAVSTKLSLTVLPAAAGEAPVRMAGFCSDLSVSGVSFIPEANGDEPKAAVLSDGLVARAVRVCVTAGDLSLSIAGRIARKRQVVFNGYRVTALGIRFAEMPPRLRGAFFAFAEGSRDFHDTLP
ncbi:MAG: cyclic nucleotide-binding domain-containing protein [Desulfobacterales bacterium]|nr:cyclic nucleotide-binding domain-containing protein [Desulfobacterales bacterium]